MPITYYGSRISPHMTKTPEGFLVCHDVPINRTGVYRYNGNELGPFGEGAPDKEFSVLRRPEEVFAEDALASFEMKPACDGHPPEDVTPDNIHYYGKGHVHNVRRGTGKDEGYTIADIMITDPQLIEDVENGNLREVSCGYNYTIFENPNGTLEQRAIRGNHIAIVKDGRAGGRVAIRDSKTERRTTAMGKSVLGRMFKSFAKDATPEELEAAATELYAPKQVAEDSEPVAAPALAPAPTAPLKEPAHDETPTTDALLMQLIEMMKPVCAALAKPEPAKVPGEDEDELSKLIMHEEAEEHGYPKEENEDPGLDGSGNEDYDPIEDDAAVSVPPEKIKSMDSAATAARTVREILRKNITDPVAFKVAAKDAAAAINKEYGIVASNTGYSKVLSTTRAAVQTSALDAAKSNESAAELSQKAYDARNPHKRKEVK